MMKKLYNSLLLAALLCGLSLGVTSCKGDDDNNGQSEEQKQEEQQNAQAEKALKFWNVVGQLVSMNDVTDDYEDKTFEPVIGTEGTDAQTRVVFTNDAATAALRFANLVGADDVTEQTSSYAWSDPDVGTLTYTKVTDGTAWAKVSVSIKQVPHLTQIVYRASNQNDANYGEHVANHGRAYYRFGDVVSRKNDNGITEYWICVRPAFDPEDKGDTHWACVSPVPKSNQRSYTSSTGHDFVLPKDLPTSKEHMQNLAEMLYAIYYPEQWQTNLINYHRSGLKMFHDFSFDNISLHNNHFWANVQKEWENMKIAETVFGLNNARLKTMINGEGLYLLYSGNYWNTVFSNSPTLYQAHYYNTPGGKNANMHVDNPCTSVSKQVVFKGQGEKDIVINIAKSCTQEHPYLVNYKFFDDENPRYIVRIALGKELSSTGKYANNQFPITGVQEVYRYYRDAVAETNLDQKPEITGENNAVASNAPDEGKGGTYMIGDVVEDEGGSRWFCINGSPYNSDEFSTITDHNAWFVSFDGIQENEIVASNIITERELPEVTFRFLEFLGVLISSQTPAWKYDPKSGTLGQIGNHINDYAGVDLRKLAIKIDSTWTFLNYKEQKNYSSKSTSFAFNFAYNDGESTDRQPIARIIFDNTQAGTNRNNCEAKSGKTYNDWRYLCYKNYETYDPDRITLTDDEEGLKMTKWHALWPVTDDPMTLQDVADETKVKKYAKGDKWQKSPRTSAEPSAEIADYCWNREKHDFISQKTSLFKEPVLFMRVMKVEDKGGKTPNLTSTDGRRLKIVHLQNDKDLYEQKFQSIYVYAYVTEYNKAFYLNNKLYKFSKMPGF